MFVTCVQLVSVAFCHHLPVAEYKWYYLTYSFLRLKIIGLETLIILSTFSCGFYFRAVICITTTIILRNLNH